MQRISNRFVDQGFIAEIDQDGMVVGVELTAENIEAEVFRPSCRISVPSIQLLGENLLAHVARNLIDILLGFTLWDQIDPWLVSQFPQ